MELPYAKLTFGINVLIEHFTTSLSINKYVLRFDLLQDRFHCKAR